VPDLTGKGVGGFCVPNAQHAVRQGKLLSKNIVATLRGEGVKDYFHQPAGAVAGLGLGIGVFQKGKIGITGFPAWVMHRGYHGLAMPTWERKIRVIGNWAINLVVGRDLASLVAVETPRAAFEEFASRPRAAAPAAAAPAPAAETPAVAASAALAAAAAPAATTAAPAAKKAPAKKLPNATAKKAPAEKAPADAAE